MSFLLQDIHVALWLNNIIEFDNEIITLSLVRISQDIASQIH